MFSRSKFVGWGFVVFLCLGAVSSEAFSREIARVTLSPGWATFATVVPRGLATNALQVGSLQTQTDVKNRWADNTIKFAVLTWGGRGVRPELYTLHCKVYSSGLTPLRPEVVVVLNHGTLESSLPDVSAGPMKAAVTLRVRDEQALRDAADRA